MKTLKSFTLAMSLFFAGCNMSGCGLTNSDPMIDTRKDEEGNLIMLDTEKNWEFFKYTVDMRIDKEKKGEDAPGGGSWNEHWLRRIHKNEKDRENSDKYTSYIIDARRKSGLPELETSQE